MLLKAGGHGGHGAGGVGGVGLSLNILSLTCTTATHMVWSRLEVAK